MFSNYDQGRLSVICEKAKLAQRCGPELVELNELIAKRRAVFTAIKMPAHDGFFITLGLSGPVMNRLASSESAVKVGEVQKDKYAFFNDARDAFDFARSLGQDLNIGLFDFGRTKSIVDEVGEQKWNDFVDDLQSFLINHSLDGKGVAEFADGRYGLIGESAINAEDLERSVMALAEEHGVLCTAFQPEVETVAADLSGVSEWEAEKSLAYMVTHFEEKGVDEALHDLSLSQGIEKLARGDEDKLTLFRDMLERLDFLLVFQPIVSLESREVHQYEIRARFKSGDTHDWVLFAEDNGLASKLDAAICERVINHINFKSGGSRTKFTTNVTAAAAQDSGFLAALKKLLPEGKGLEERMMFEITNAQHIDDLDAVRAFIDEMHSMGYKVALDDFGVGPAALRIMNLLGPDAVKIDRQYVLNAMASDRARGGLKYMVRMCADLKIAVYAEFIETEEVADFLLDIGVQYGQGYLFGASQETMSYQPPQK